MTKKIFAVIAVVLMCTSPVFLILTSADAFAETYDASGNLTYSTSAESAEVTGLNDKDNLLDFKVDIPSTVTIEGKTYTVTSIGKNVFSGTNHLVSVTIPDSVTTIGDYAFSGCSSISSITIPDSVTTIGMHAFYECSSISSIAISENVGTIGSDAFGLCDSLTAINVAEGNSMYSSMDGVLYDKGKTEIICCPGGLKSCTVPAGVISIGTAFNSCRLLTSINVDENNQTYSSIDGVVYNHYDKTMEKGPTNLICCPGGKSVCNIPETVTEIKSNAFRYCVSLTSVTIPDSVETIEEYAFYKCSALTSITIPEKVSTIERQTFLGCTSLESANLNKVDTVSYMAFYRCESLRSISMDNVMKIDGLAFDGCKSLTSLTIPKKVTTLGEFAFCSCSSLESVELNNVQNIKRNVFDSCSSLRTVDISENVSNIDDEVFTNCTSLTAINVDVNNTSYCDIDGVLFDKEKTTLICCPAGKNECSLEGLTALTTIKSGAFYGCSSLKSIEIPDTVTSIGKSAFYGCSSLESITLPKVTGELVFDEITDLMFYGCSSLKSIEIPDTVTSIGYEAFFGCSSLTTLTIPKNVNVIGHAIYDMKNVFGSCTSLTEIKVDKKNDMFYDKDGVLYTEGNTLVCCPEGYKGELKIEEKAMSIYKHAFDGCSSLTSVAIPDNVTKIDCVFDSCSSLTSIKVNDTHGGYKSIDGVLFNKSGDELVRCPLGLTRYVIPGSVTTIADDAFRNCNLTTVTIPDTVTDIEGGIFDSCTSLTTILVGENHPTYVSVDGVIFKRNIANGTLTDLVCCPGGKTSYAIPDGVEKIESKAFNGCKNIVLSFPTSIKYISSSAFKCDFYEKDGVTEITDYSKLLGNVFKGDADTKMTVVSYITFDVNGGTEIETKPVYAGEKICLPNENECSKPGYKLVGWTCNDTTYAPGEEVIVTGDMTFKAVWEWVPPSGTSGITVGVILLCVLILLLVGLVVWDNKK